MKFEKKIPRDGQAEFCLDETLLFSKQFSESLSTSKEIGNVKLWTRRDIRKNMALVHAILARLETILFFSRVEVEILYEDDIEAPK